MRKINIKLTFYKMCEIVKRYLKKCVYFIQSLLKRILMPSITVSGLCAIFFCVFFIVCDEKTRKFGEGILEQFYYKINFISVVVTSISLCAASLAIIISIRKPKFRIRFVNNHGSELKKVGNKNYVTIGMDKDGNIGYQACIPSDWNMFLYNYGHNVAENIRVKMWFDNIYFDSSLAEKGYDLDNFMYGCGIFIQLSFDLAKVLRQDEKIEIPRIPFEYSSADSDVLKERGYTTLYVQIYCNNQEATFLKYRIEIEEYDLGEYHYHPSGQNDDIKKWERWFVEEYISNKQLKDVTEYNYYKEIEPYFYEKYKDTQLYKKIYDYYYTRDIDKMLFWGRMYYRAQGENIKNIEAILQTELLKLQMKNK